ncbi:MAG TPA: hypothetical protein DEB06_07905 [Phycisphaerales bacterium]|nr:hypothetical protein [Phycisphaerales bacterium]
MKTVRAALASHGGRVRVFLRMLSDELDEREHAVPNMDQAGWHKARRLVVPDNMTVLHLPPYAPELNPVERLWAHLRQHDLSNRVFDDCAHLLDAGAQAWQLLMPERLRTVCACDDPPREDSHDAHDHDAYHNYANLRANHFEHLDRALRPDR